MKRLLILTLLLVASCDNPPAQYPRRCMYHLSVLSGKDTTWVDEAAEAEVAVMQTSRLFHPYRQWIPQRIKAKSEDTKIIGYYPFLVTSLVWGWPDSTIYDAWPYIMDKYHVDRGFWAYTTEGDTLQIWPNTVMLNPLKRGNDLIRAQMALLRDYTSKYPLDGLLLDYMMTGIYVSSGMRQHVHGDIDLDGNGVIFSRDEAEREAFAQWQMRFCARLRYEFGQDFIIIANGDMPHKIPESRVHLNGIFYERYPQTLWGWSDRQSFEAAKDNTGLQAIGGKYYNILQCVDTENYYTFISSLLTGALYAEGGGDGYFTGWDIKTQSGAAMSGLQGDSRAYIRTFTGGTALIVFDGDDAATYQFAEEDR